MDKREEVFSLYNELNILLDRENKVLKEGDIEGALEIIEREEEVIKRLSSIPKESYILTEEDKKELLKIIDTCMKKRENNERILVGFKEGLSQKISEIEKSKKAMKTYLKREAVAPKFIDKIK